MTLIFSRKRKKKTKYRCISKRMGQMNNNGVALCCLKWAVALTQHLHNKTFLSLHRLLHFCSWLGFPFLTLGGIKSQTFCNCPWERAGHFHHGLKLKRNKWHTLVYGNYTCGVWWQPAGAPSNFKIRNSSICTSLYWRCLQRRWPEHVRPVTLLCSLLVWKDTKVSNSTNFGAISSRRALELLVECQWFITVKVLWGAKWKFLFILFFYCTLQCFKKELRGNKAVKTSIYLTFSINL